MARTLSDDEVRLNLDRSHPLIEQNTAALGRWIPDRGGGQRWQGALNWRTQHGNVTVYWSLGRPSSVWGARLPDGKRVNAQSTMGGPSPWRYRASGEPRRWIHGSVYIQTDDATFAVGEQPRYETPSEKGASGHPDLEADLASDLEFKQRLIDEEFADTLYGYLENGDFYKEGSERIWSIGARSAAALVARLRERGDTYIYYFPHGGRRPVPQDVRNARLASRKPEMSAEEAAVQATLIAWVDEITQKMAEHGWRKPNEQDWDHAAAATRRDLDALESRPETSVPGWASHLLALAAKAITLRARGASSLPVSQRAIDRSVLVERLRALALTGRVSEAEYRALYGRISQVR